MKKIIILSIFLCANISLFCQYSDHEKLIRSYYRNLETPGMLKKAYDMFKRTTDYETFKGWYEDVESIYVGPITEVECSKYNFIVMMSEFTDDEHKDYDSLVTTFYNVTTHISAREYWEEPAIYSSWEFTMESVKSIPIESPFTPEQLTVIRYYKFMEKPESLRNAFNMSKKGTSWEQYKSWYDYDRAYIDIEFLSADDKDIEVMLIFTSKKAGFGEQYSGYRVKIEADENYILNSKSNPIYNNNIKMINKYFIDNKLYDEDELLWLIWKPVEKGYYTAINGHGMLHVYFSDNKIDSHKQEYIDRGGKPVIYLYPKKSQETFVNVKPNGKFIVTIPPIKDGWNVVAEPDGTIFHKDTNKEYPYLFWEAYAIDMQRPEEGFVVKREELDKFFDDKLSYLGLIKKEIDDFKEYWIPHMQEDPWYFINFIPKSELDRVFPVEIIPEPDTFIRVYFTHKGLPEQIEFKEQSLKKAKRIGYIATEWGGTINRK